MPIDAPNRKFYTYIDGHGTSWNKMGQIDAGCNALDGNAAAVAGIPNRPKDGRRWRTRKAIFQDPASFRTKTCVIYTQAAATALSGSSTVAVFPPGGATSVTYTFQELLPDRTPTRSISRNLAEPA